MRFPVDAQFPLRLAQLLRRAGHDAVPTCDLPVGNRTADAEISRMARHEQQIVISRDADFVDAFLLRGEPPQLLWGTAGNLSNDELMRLLWLAAQFAGRLRAAKLAELTADDLIIHP